VERLSRLRRAMNSMGVAFRDVGLELAHADDAQGKVVLSHVRGIPSLCLLRRARLPMPKLRIGWSACPPARTYLKLDFSRERSIFWRDNRRVKLPEQGWNLPEAGW
jgi:hypothetical protein